MNTFGTGRVKPAEAPGKAPPFTKLGKAAARPLCLLHIGYHRTGSSFLQTELFPRIPDCAWSPYTDEAERNAADPALRLAVLTNESLSSDLERDRPERAAELAERFPGARVLIGIRSQYTVMRGAYHLHMKGGATESYEAFVAARCRRLFDYAGLVEAYRARFGAERVLVLLHEDLCDDPSGTIARLLAFMDVDPAVAALVHHRRVKPSVGDAALHLLRQRNRVVGPFSRLWPRAHAGIIHRGLPGIRLLDWLLERKALLHLPTDRVRPMIRAGYAAGNARLFDSLGKDITAYDYPRP